jgi:hypothetical protein
MQRANKQFRIQITLPLKGNTLSPLAQLMKAVLAGTFLDIIKRFPPLVLLGLLQCNPHQAPPKTVGLSA